MHSLKLFTFNLAGLCKVLFVFFLFSLGRQSLCFALSSDSVDWNIYSQEMVEQIEKDRLNGFSYIISGTLALVGGIVGDQLAKDPSEAAAYTLFQTIGVASVGYGFYVWQIGERDRSIYETLNLSGLSQAQKNQYLRAHFSYLEQFRKKDRLIRAITHGLIAGLNFYNGSRQKQDSLKNTFNFIGRVNLLACLSFSVEF